jgi:hypothetical protein
MHVGDDCTSGLRPNRDCRESPDLASQQEMGLLPDQRYKPDYINSLDLVLDPPFRVEVGRMPSGMNRISLSLAAR